MTAAELLFSMRTRPGRWCALLVALPLVLRFWFVATGQLALVQDEAQYWDWTRHLQLTYYSKGPLIAWIITAGTWVAGNTELGVRLGSIAGSALFPALLYFLVARVWKRPVLAVLCVALAAASPLFQALGVLMTTDNPFVLCWAAAMTALYAGSVPAAPAAEQGVERPGPGAAPLWPTLLLVAAFGVGILAKYTMLGFAGLAVLYGLLLRRQGALPRAFWPRLFAALFVGAALGFSPTLIWNMQNGYVGYKHVLQLIGVTGDASHAGFRLSRMPEFAGTQFGFALPWWFWLALVAGVRAARKAWKPSSVPAERLNLDFRQCALLALTFWPMTLFFLFWSLHAKVLANWNTVSLVSATVLCAAEVERLLSRPTEKRLRWLKIGAVASLALTLFIHLHQLLPLPQSINPAHRLKGWDDLGRHMREVVETRFDAPERVFLMSNVYDITAELAFYTPGQPQAFCLWDHDRRMNQYDLWPGPQERQGWDAVLVLRGDSAGLPPVVPTMFERVLGPYRHVALYRGEPARTFYYYVCYGYNGLWPRRDNDKF